MTPTPHTLAANFFDPAERPDLVRLLTPLVSLEADDDVERVAAALLARRRRQRLAAEGITIHHEWTCPCFLRDPSGGLHRQGSKRGGQPGECYDFGSSLAHEVRGMEDHLRCWRRDRDLVAVTFEPYGLIGAEAFAVAARSLSEDDLVLSVCACCTVHFPGWTTLVKITRREDRDSHCIG